MNQTAIPPAYPGTKKVDREALLPERLVFEEDTMAKFVLPSVRSLFQHSPVQINRS
jgi:hypothetical protein